MHSFNSRSTTSQPAAAGQQQQQQHQQRRRQQRLHLSCAECRRRKIRCDRAKPCHPCVKVDRGDHCQYDTPPAASGRVVPGQLVFAARPAPPPPPPPPPSRPRGQSGVQADQQPHRRHPPPTASIDSRQQQDQQLQQEQQQSQRRHPPSPSSLSTFGSARTGVTGTGYPPPNGPPADAIPPLRQFWHGTKAGDQYVSPFDRRTITVPKEVVFGDNDATVFWGRSHEANFVPRITDMTTSLLRSVEEGEVQSLFEVERHTRPTVRAPAGTDPDLLGLLPLRPTADRLWRTYIDNFESYYRILHVPTFEREYRAFWATQQGPRYFLAQLLSICAIASCFRDDDRLYQEAQVRTWIEAVRQWLFRADPRAQLSLGYLQAHLLMLVAGDVHWMKIDRSWISSGALIRTAVSAGLHREPRDFVRVSPFHAELRRRLWYSILEYDLLTSFAKGRTPTVREDEYDCDLPASTRDAFFSDTSTESAIRQPAHTPAPSGGGDEFSFHGPSPPINVILAKHLALRSRVCRAINGIQLDVDYDEVLRLDAEIKEFLRESSQAAGDEAGSFQRTLSTILSQRCVIALHAPFVTRALNDPKWIYSRTRCLETARAILSEALAMLDHQPHAAAPSMSASMSTSTLSSSASPSSTPIAVDVGPFATLTNICRCEISNSVFLICHELLAQAVEQRGLAEHRSLLNPARTSSFRTAPGQWELRDKEALVALVARTSMALDRVSKSDLISQRTCAWVRLSAELCRAAAPNDEATIPTVREAIRRGIQAWRTSRGTQPPPAELLGAAAGTAAPPVGSGQNLRPPANNVMMPPVFEGALDEDYFNLFFDINTLGGFE